MAGKKSDISKVNRLKILEGLLERLKKTGTKNYSDIDLILDYLEKFISDPNIGGKSKKSMEFKVERDISSMSTNYQISWKKPDYERVL